MKTVTTLPPPALSHKPRVKKLLIRGIIHLTSNKFSIFVGVIATLILYIGVVLDDTHTIGYGGVIFLVSFTPWALRETARYSRQDKLGINNDKW